MAGYLLGWWWVWYHGGCCVDGVYWVFSVVLDVEREEGRQKLERERLKYILLYNLYYFNVLYCKIKVKMLS